MKSLSVSQKMLFSFILSLLIGLGVFFFIYAIPAKQGDYFNAAVIWMFMSYCLLFGAALALLLRLTQILKYNTHFLYLFLSVANICSWLLCITLYMLGKIGLWWMYQSYLNLLVGLVMQADTWLAMREP